MAPVFEFVVSIVDVSEGHADLAVSADPDDLLPLETARWAPELRGRFGLPAVSRAQMRAGIAKGSLQAFRPGHAILTTRRHIEDWLCHARKNPLPSHGMPNAKSGSSASNAPRRGAAFATEHASAARIAEQLKASARAWSRSKGGSRTT